MAHIHEKIDFCAEAFIVYKDKVLLRVHDKDKFWLSVGGHIELDEDPVEAVIREAKEEVGLDIEIVGDCPATDNTPENRGYQFITAPRYLGRHPVNENHEHVVFVYFARSSTDVIFDSVLDHEKGVEVKWFSMEDLENTELVPNVKFYAVEALKALGDTE